MPYVRTGQRKVLSRGRIGRKRSRSASAVMITPAAKRTKRKQWTEDQMEAVKSWKSGINRAAIDHGIPPTTLKDRLSGRVQNSTPGPVRYLSNNEEKELGTFIKDCASIGYGTTRKEVMSIVESQAMHKGVLRKERISHGW